MTKAETKPKAMVWDLDGTLSDDRARAHFVQVEKGRARDWKSYFDAIDQDPPIAASMEVLRSMHAAGIRILFLTGRPEHTRPKTERWLKANGLTEYDRLLMRPPGEFRPAGRFKVEVIERLRGEYELVCAFEDRRDVAEALRQAGLPVFLYGAGAQAAAEALEAEEREEVRAQGDLFGDGAKRRDDARPARRPAAKRAAPERRKPAAGAKPSPARKAAERGKKRAAKGAAVKRPTRPGEARKKEE